MCHHIYHSKSPYVKIIFCAALTIDQWSGHFYFAVCLFVLASTAFSLLSNSSICTIADLLFLLCLITSMVNQLFRGFTCLLTLFLLCWFVCHFFFNSLLANFKASLISALRCSLVQEDVNCCRGNVFNQ